MKYYVVFRGFNPGVYDKWEETKEQTNGFSGALYKSYSSSEEAADAFRNYSGEDDLKDLQILLNIIHETSVSTHNTHYSSRQQLTQPIFPPTNPEIDPEAWAVDAACAGNPGVMENLLWVISLITLNPIPLSCWMNRKIVCLRNFKRN